MAVNNNRSITGGVADYYAILGVSDKLIWKHSQKTFMGSDKVHDGKSKDGSSIMPSKVDEEQEQKKQQLQMKIEQEEYERYLREIVQVTIVATYTTSNSQQQGDAIHKNDKDVSSIVTSANQSTPIPMQLCRSV